MSDAHDPLCPWLPPLRGQGGTGPVTHYPCLCDFIAKVRWDEANRAAARIIRICGHTKYVGVESCIHDDCVDAVKEGRP